MARCTDKASMVVEVCKLSSESSKLKWLKDQIKILTLGFGWKECAVPFSKKGNVSIGAVQNLTSELERVIDLVKDKVPPAEPPVRGAACWRIPVLGIMSEQRRTLDNEGYTRGGLAHQGRRHQGSGRQ